MGASALTMRRGGASAARQDALPPLELATLLWREARRYRVVLATIFGVIALLVLLAGLFVLPQKYTSATTILAQESDIIQPLLEGRAVSTNVADRAGIARQVVYGRKVMLGALQAGGWLETRPDPVEQERLIEDIQGRTRITAPRENLVEITYSDSDPERTFRVTQRLADLFIEESLATKERESREAYEFINKQVGDYHDKLTGAEANLQAYRSANADAQPGSATDVSTRISALRTQVEQSRMQLMEHRSSESALASQLSGESAVTAVQTRESVYRAQLLELQGQLDSLLLNFTEQHPDVVRVRHQMADIQTAMRQASERRDRPGADNGALGDAQLNPLYQELRSRLSESRREAAAAQSRMAASQSLLDEELGRSRRIAASESSLAELTRDYEVNRDIYQDLLRRRENARVSMELDREKRGLTLRIQDPAAMPLRPSGLRLMHFALGGLVLAVAIPLALLFVKVRFDARVRSVRQLEGRGGAAPILAVVPRYLTARDRRNELGRTLLSASIVVGVALAFGIAYGYRQLHA